MYKQMYVLSCLITIFIFVLLSGCSNEEQANKYANHSFIYYKTNCNLLKDNDYYNYDSKPDYENSYFENIIANENDEDDEDEMNYDYKIDSILNIALHESRMAISSINAIVISPDGSLWGWGLNLFGELGADSRMPSSIPIQIGSDMDWVQLTMGLHHTMALKDDGSLWTWGACIIYWINPANSYPSDADQQTSPVRFGDDYNWISVFTGSSHAFGIKSNGSLWAWGRNRTGMLGDGTTIPRYTPVQIGDCLDWIYISPGRDNTFGIKSDGSLWAWGSNRLGRLGINEHALPSLYQSYPIQIGADARWVHVSTGGGHTIALQENGSLWGWGENRFGQLGDGTTIDRVEPTHVYTNTTWVHAVAGDRMTYAICIDGYLWAWGWNHNGELGIGTTENSSVPVQIGTDSNWVDVVAASRPLAKTDCGAIWSWGPGEVRVPTQGSLGDGTSEDHHVPIIIIPSQGATY